MFLGLYLSSLLINSDINFQVGSLKLQRLGGPFREDMVVYMGVCVDLGDSRVDGGGEGVKWARRSIQGRYNVYMRMYWKERQI